MRQVKAFTEEKLLVCVSPTYGEILAKFGFLRTGAGAQFYFDVIRVVLLF